MSEKESVVDSRLSKFDSKLNYLMKRSWLSLLIICSTSLTLRFIFFTELPLTHDSLSYFAYSNDLLVLGKIPPIQLELGWPVVLSLIFSVTNYENMIDYMTLQRTVSVIISVITIIPVYFLGKRFFEKPYPLVAAALFGFEPHLIQNSLMGISEPLFILVGTTSLVLFLSNNIRLVYVSFALTALFVIIRSQGIFLFTGLSILFLLHYRKERKILVQYGILLGIFVLILVPVVLERQSSLGYDIFLQSATSSAIALTSIDTNDSQFKQNILDTGSKVLVNQLGKSLIPYFIIFLPFGFLLFLKDIDFKKISILFTLILTVSTALYILTFNHDMRHIFFVFPIYSIIALFSVKYMSSKISFKNLFLFLIIISVVVMSGYFLYANDDRNLQSEANEISNFILQNTTTINGQTLVSHYVPSNYYLDERFPILSTSLEKEIKIVNLYAETVDEYMEIAKENELTHLIIDSKNPRIFPLDEVFYNSEKYVYLNEIYDSTDYNFKEYHVKIFEFDYDKFDEINQSKG